MRPIHTKLIRDLWNMRGAVITIAVVVAAGVSAYVTLHGTWLSIVAARDRYYSNERFGDVFAQLERAPNAKLAEIEALPGVERVYARVGGPARVPLPALREPAQARILSLPDDGTPPLNGVRLLRGRFPQPERSDEAVLIEKFSEAHDVRPGSTLRVILEGRERDIRVVGIGMSPEYVLSVPAGSSTPAPERFAVLWMPRRAVEAAFDMSGAFNDLVLDLGPTANPDATIASLDEMLVEYGSPAALLRERQTSNYFLNQDLGQLETMATLAPLIFLSVAAFLLNVVLSRFVELDRQQIATLKAVGYKNRDVGLHYLQLTLLIAITGGTVGLGTGALLGRALTGLYVEWYRMPALHYVFDLSLATKAMTVALIAGLFGSFFAVSRVVKLPPAEAMRPPAPTSYRRGLLAGLLEVVTPAARMVLRELMRRPARTATSAFGVAACTGILVVGQFFSDALVYLVDYYMQAAQRESLAVSFVNPVEENTVRALKAIDGVLDVQQQATRQVRVRAGHRDRIVGMIGRGERRSLRPLIDDEGREQHFGPGEVLFTEILSRVLDVKPGDRVTVEPVQGDRTPRVLTMTGTVDELLGMWIHMDADDMHHLLREAPLATDAHLFVEAGKVDHVQDELNDMPSVSAVMRKDVAIADFRKQSADSMGAFSLVLTLFAVTIAVAVVYNNARVALSLRSRELASLRVLGFTRSEVSWVLIGELMTQVALGVPLGLGFGKLLVAGMLAANDPETFRLSPNISAHTFAFASLVTICAAVASALIVRRQLDKLDLIEVLKTRE